METLKYALLTGLGSFLGGAGRYLVSVALQIAAKAGYPISTFVVNVVGSFAIGIVLALWEKNSVSDAGRIFLATGILGGFTTFSSFSQEILLMLRSGQSGLAIFYVGTSVALGLGACALGYLLLK